MNFFGNLTWAVYNKGLAFLNLTGGAEQQTAQTADAAADAAENTGGILSFLPSILLWVGMFAALYFFLIRPQRKRDKAQREMQSALKVGDRVLTTSGMFGKIVDVGTDAFMVEFGDNRGIRIPIRKADVVGIKTPNMAPPNREVSAVEDKKEDK